METRIKEISLSCEEIPYDRRKLRRAGANPWISIKRHVAAQVRLK